MSLWLLGKITKHIMGKHQEHFNSPSCQVLTVRVRFLQGGSELTTARDAEANGEQQMHSDAADGIFLQEINCLSGREKCNLTVSKEGTKIQSLNSVVFILSHM